MRALVTFGINAHERLLRIALPSFQGFADLHGYELVVAKPKPSDRAPSWRKVPVLLELLERFDEVLWVDADTVIVDPSEDMPVPDDAWQAVVKHQTREGEVPNLGVWFIRRQLAPTLLELWSMRQYVAHRWWEQGAMLELLGYTNRIPIRHETITPIFDRTHFLASEWNWHEDDRDRGDRRRIMHAAAFPLQRRENLMCGWAAQTSRVAA